MPKKPQAKGGRGSQKWIQVLVNEKTEIFDTKIKDRLPSLSGEKITWLSPKADDAYAEYQDQKFVERLGVKLEKVPLREFWPRGGPCWDAFGKSDKGTIFLVEAKAHISEINSPGTRATKQSLSQIQARLEETKRYLNGTTDVDWSKNFYQYTNRLAHLYLLRVLNKLSAYLIFIYFVNDVEMGGPKSADEWSEALERLHTQLGIRQNTLSNYIVELFIDVDFAK